MTLGGLAAGFAVALAAGAVARVTVIKEDASLAAFYLISLALGVTIVSLRGSAVDLFHVLFGNVLALVQRWHGESRTVVAVLHDIETVRRAFPQTLLLARESVAWGATAEVLTAANLLKARRMVEAFDSHAEPCERDAA